MPELDADVAPFLFQPANHEADLLQVVEFKGIEIISGLYRFELTLVSKDPSIDYETVLNQPAVFTICSDF